MRKILTASAAGFTILSGALFVFWLVGDGSVAPAVLAGAFSIAALILAHTASSGSRQEKVAAAFVVASFFALCYGAFGGTGLVIGAIVLAAAGAYFFYRYVTPSKPSKATVKSKHKPANVMAFVALLAVACGAIAAAITSNGSFSEETTHAITADFDGKTLDVRFDLASIDQPFVGDGLNVATPPVLNDGKGLITSWGNFYDRVLALPQAGRDNTIANVNTWHETTKRVNADRPELWFPNWSEIETSLRFVAGEFRVILKVNTSKTDQQAKDAIRAAYPNSPELMDLPVVTIDGSIVNTECGGGDCRNSATPAQQFIDTNGQFRIMLTKPILGKEQHWSTNFEAAKHGIGLATECGNGFLGVIKQITPAIVQTVKSATGGPSSTTTIVTTTNTTTGSTTTRVTTTTPSTTTTTTSTTTPSTSTTTTGTTTSTTTTSTTTTSTTTTGTTTTTTPPVTTTTTTPVCEYNPELPPNHPDCFKPKPTETTSYTHKPDAPDATTTGPAAPPTTPDQPAGTTTTEAPITSATAPSAIPTEEPTEPTSTANSSQTAAPGTESVDPDAPQQPLGAPLPQVVVPEPVTPEPHVDLQESAPVVIPEPEPVVVEPAPVIPAAPATEAQLPPAVVVEPAAPVVPVVPVVPTQELQAPAPTTQAPAPASQAPATQVPTTVAEVAPAAVSHSTENGGFIAGALALIVSAVFALGFLIHRRRNAEPAPAHKAR